MELKEAAFYNTLSSRQFNDLLTTSRPSLPNDQTLDESALKEDLWSFGYFWPEVTEKISSVEELYATLQEIQWKIGETKEKFSPLALRFPNFHIELNRLGGINGSYFLLDDKGNKHFLIKPLDEDAGAINHDGWATPFSMSPLRANIRLYQSAMREVLGYTVAEAASLHNLVPKTVFGIFESDQFHDFSEGVSLDELKRYMELCGPVKKEKLCSVQEYIPHSKSLFEVIHDFQEAGLSDEEIASRFDQTNFEEANILLWMTYDTDGHMGNFLVYSKGIDQVGNEILALKKIDNGLAFPEKNQQLRNNLTFLPNGKYPLSEGSKQKIAQIDVESLSKQFEKMGLESAIPAFKKRISVLQKLAQEPNLTIKEINTAMSKIGKKL